MTGNPRNGLNLPVSPSGTRGWSNGLFSCFQDLGLCCMSTWCACIVFQRNKDRYEHLQATNLPLPKGSDPFGEDFAIYAMIDVCCGAGWILQITGRSDVRRRYAIESSELGDCAASFCCGPCSLTQVSRELQIEENVLLGMPVTHNKATKQTPRTVA
ncbi:PLAC8 family-domain-containing protein [Mrakia frigida]|uniref:PLAC8 family protein n=1 Tax=Mrakia frigida TaxID=29902 RepID=UPI003FCC11D1